MPRCIRVFPQRRYSTNRMGVDLYDAVGCASYDLVLAQGRGAWYRAKMTTSIEVLSRRRRAQRGLWLIACIVVGASATGCPKPQRRTLVAEVPRTGDARARAAFADVRRAFLQDGAQASEFAKLEDAYPQDPIAPWVKLYRGIAAVKAGAYAEALPHFDAVTAALGSDPALLGQATVYRAIAQIRLLTASRAAVQSLTTSAPELAAARDVLRAHSSDFARPEATGASASDDAQREYADMRGEFWAALAMAQAGLAEPQAALSAWDRYAQGASPTERVWAEAQAEVVVAGRSRTDLQAWWSQRGPTPAISTLVVGKHLLALLPAEDRLRGDVLRAIQDEQRAQGYRVGEPVNTAKSPAVLTAIALTPSDAKQQRVADALAAGVWAATLPSLTPADTAGATVQLAPYTDAAGAAAAFDSAVAAGAAVVIGPIDGAAVDAVVARANASQASLLTLAARPAERGRGDRVWHMLHAAEARARSLVDTAVAAGVKTFAVLAPQTGYGKAVAQAFVDQVGVRGGRVVVRADYAADAKAFTQPVAKLGSEWQAVFVADTAEHLELIAPTLAAAGQLARPLHTKKVTGGRAVLLLSTAEGASATLLRQVGRYLDGAMLAPGYVAGAVGALRDDFEAAFVAQHLRAPTALEAYAFDAVELATVAACHAKGLAEALRANATGYVGATGKATFAQGLRTDAGVLYQVVNQAGSWRYTVHMVDRD